MKKSIIALSAFLLLFVLFSTPTQADIMSAEDRAILRSQLESTPIGEWDPWDEIDFIEIPESENNSPSIVESILNTCISIGNSISEFVDEVIVSNQLEETE